MFFSFASSVRSYSCHHFCRYHLKDASFKWLASDNLVLTVGKLLMAWRVSMQYEINFLVSIRQSCVALRSSLCFANLRKSFASGIEHTAEDMFVRIPKGNAIFMKVRFLRIIQFLIYRACSKANIYFGWDNPFCQNFLY